ncbi:MAG TPA: hypothetical protein PLY97_10525, partial [Acidocella sp.]|nr:hypothetical protein [Acidocella sp.]
MNKVREFYIPFGAIKVSDKNSDAVAYVFTNIKGKPAAMLFVGKQSKPLWHYYYATEARREAAIIDAFANRRAILARKA